MVKLQTQNAVIHQAAKPKMFKSIVISFLSLLLTSSVFSIAATAQANSSIAYKASEVSEKDGLPVLMKHLPDGQTAGEQAIFATNVGDLKAVLGDRPVVYVTLRDLIEKTNGGAATRADLHIGRSRDGELFITSRQDGMIRMLF